MQAVTITQITIYELTDMIQKCIVESINKSNHNEIEKLEIRIKELEKTIKTINYEPKQTNRRLPK
jgi:hypothetical protein